MFVSLEKFIPVPLLPFDGVLLGPKFGVEPQSLGDLLVASCLVPIVAELTFWGEVWLWISGGKEVSIPSLLWTLNKGSIQL